MKNNSKAMVYVALGYVALVYVALVYVALGFVGAILCIWGIAKMWLSTKFLPVYIGTTYVIGNQILRYFLYALLIVGVALSAKLADYGISFLLKRFRKTGRR